MEAQKLAHIGNWEWDLVSDEAIGSAEMLRLLGLHPLELGNRFTIQSFIECLQPEDREWVQQALAKAVEESGTIDYENRIVSSDGTVRIIHEYGEVVLDEAGQPVKMIGTAQDITRSKQAEEALGESEARLRSALELAQLSCYEWNPRTGALNWDLGLKELWGLPPDTSVDDEIFMAGIHPDDRDAVQTEISRSSDPAGDGNYIAEYRVIGKQDKQERWISAQGKTFFEDDVAVRHVGVAQNITAHKEAEETNKRLLAEVQHERKQLDIILSTVPGVVWQAWGKPDEATQRIDFVSDYVEAMLGYSVQQWLSTPNFWLQIVHPEDREQTSQQTAEQFASGNGGTLQFRWIERMVA